MVNGFRYYRALESVSMIASALSTALTIYPCQIRVHQHWQSKLQLPTARKKEWRPATAGSSPPCGNLSTLIHTTLVGLEPATFRSLVRRATSSATEPDVVKWSSMGRQLDMKVLHTFWFLLCSWFSDWNSHWWRRVFLFKIHFMPMSQFHPRRGQWARSS